MLVRQSAELETNVVSVERLKEYSEVDTEVCHTFCTYKYYCSIISANNQSVCLRNVVLVI